MGKKLNNEEDIQSKISEINDKYADKFNLLTTEYTKEILNLVKDIEEVSAVVEDESKKAKDLNSIFDRIGSWLSIWKKDKK